MTREDSNSIEFIYCACGCGLTRPKRDVQGRRMKFIKGHTNGTPIKLRNFDRNFQILCNCGCGQTRPKFDVKGKIYKYIHGHNARGETHPSYKHGRRRQQYNFKNTKTKQIPEHRYIYEQSHKCCVLPWVVVHHNNDIKRDNRIDNLKTMTRAEHCAYHLTKDKSGRVCSRCGSNTTRKTRNRYPWVHDPNDRTLWWCIRCYEKSRGH